MLWGMGVYQQSVITNPYTLIFASPIPFAFQSYTASQSGGESHVEFNSMCAISILQTSQY